MTTRVRHLNTKFAGHANNPVQLSCPWSWAKNEFLGLFSKKRFCDVIKRSHVFAILKI